MMQVEPFDVKSDGLHLEGRVHLAGELLAALVLHPHPQYGGDMDNHVVVACCETLALAGATAFRFNFRGVGGSEGTYSGGMGEASDARSALTVVGADSRTRP